MKRRTFLATTAAASLLPAKALKTIGVQLYTVRTLLPDKPLETLKAIEQIGFKECEAVYDSLDKLWPSLQQTTLKAVSVHLPTSVFMKEQGKLPAILEDVAKKGFKFAVCPYIAPADRGGVEVMKKLAETLNQTGAKCRAAGLTLAYHNHAFEFEPAAGGTLLDVLLSSTDPKNVTLELDIMWSQVAGVNPVSLLEKYKGRVPLVHVKNVKAGTEKRYNEQVPREAFAEAGQGMIDIPAVLKAGAKSGVKHYFVEQDQTPGNPLDSLRGSFGYLDKL